MSALRVIQRVVKAIPIAALVVASTASAAAIPYTPAVPSNGVVGAWPAQNLLAPTGAAFQTNYPYPGQCVADALNGGTGTLFPLLSLCPATGSFDATTSQRTAGGWAATGLVPFAVLNPILPNSKPAAGVPATPKFVWNVLNPPAYTPDTTTYPGADYYEIGLHEAWGFQTLAGLGAFPNPVNNTANAALVLNGNLLKNGADVPNGMQWTGLVCNIAAGCSCPADASATFAASYCTAGGKVPLGAPLYTPIWGVGQINMGGTLGVALPATSSPWSQNQYVATWPSISIRANRGTPVVVKWVNEFPNNHVLCPHPEAADWPCAIDRTFMGVKVRTDPALTDGKVGAVPPDGVNQFGSPQQPDNSWVTHLHGGEIPPSTDGFAEKWFGNQVTASKYANLFVSPPFENPSNITLKRPTGSSDIYTYPMVQEEGTIWFHDHTLGKTHHNVIAGPAGFFPVKDTAKHGAVAAGVCAAGDCSYSWLDPVTEPRGALSIPKYDFFLAIQDRAFNDDGSINFSNGLGQVTPLVPKRLPLPIGYTPVTPGVNPQVHPTWVPEYFGDHVLVNGVLWPNATVSKGWYRLRLVDGSDSRCWTVGFSNVLPAPATKPTNNVPFYVIGNDQGYLAKPVLAPGNQFTMCPGERYELLVNFGAPAVGAATTAVYMTNSAAAPFPAGITPFAGGSPYAEMNVIMKFTLNGGDTPVTTCGAGTVVTNTIPNTAPARTYTYPNTFASTGTCIPDPALYGTDPSFVDIRPKLPLAAGNIVRQMYLNERIDGVTLAPMGMQLNGVPFEYKVTETPKKNTKEVWQFINLTVDAHPMHPHLVSHQVVARQAFNVGAYKALLCGSSTCQPGTAPGGEMQVVPDVTPLLTGTPTLVTAASVEGGRKDAVQAPPGMVTTIVADWTPRWAPVSATPAAATAPGAPAAACDPTLTPPACANASSFTYEDVTAGPYVWHCHINSHEDSEMMRTSLVVP